jgi:predicted small lipoprotein YifL
VKILIFSLALMLSACGMQGDLYLPDETETSTEQVKEG